MKVIFFYFTTKNFLSQGVFYLNKISSILLRKGKQFTSGCSSSKFKVMLRGSSANYSCPIKSLEQELIKCEPDLGFPGVDKEVMMMVEYRIWISINILWFLLYLIYLIIIIYNYYQLYTEASLSAILRFGKITLVSCLYRWKRPIWDTIFIKFWPFDSWMLEEQPIRYFFFIWTFQQLCMHRWNLSKTTFL